MKNIIRKYQRSIKLKILRSSPFNSAPSSKKPHKQHFYEASKAYSVGIQIRSSVLSPRKAEARHLRTPQWRTLTLRICKLAWVVAGRSISPSFGFSVSCSRWPCPPPPRGTTHATFEPPLSSPLLSLSPPPFLPFSLSLFSRDVCIMLEQTAKIYRDRGRAINPTN